MTYDQYLTGRKYSVYFSFGKMFAGREDALGFTLRELARQGRLVRVACRSVPDCACRNCGETLFDWQETAGELAGSACSDECWFSLSDGLVCGKCAMREAGLEVSRRELAGSELTGSVLL